jgi:hypothetical protein
MRRWCGSCPLASRNALASAQQAALACHSLLSRKTPTSADVAAGTVCSSKA